MRRTRWLAVAATCLVAASLAVVAGGLTVQRSGESSELAFDSRLSSAETSGTISVVAAERPLPAVTPMEPTPVVPTEASSAQTRLGTNPKIALTFDDGPVLDRTPQVLSILAERNVRATFFLMGCRVEGAPDLARAVAAGGHVLGNHTYGHPYLDTSSPEEIEWEIAHANEVIESVTGARPTWMRPPYGRVNSEVYSAAARLDMRVIKWTVDPNDWKEDATPEGVLSTIMKLAKPGGVVLMHDSGPATIAALPLIIDSLRAAGYELVTLDEL